MGKTDTQEIACQQVLVEDNSVFSIQWTDLPPDLSRGLNPESLLEKYLACIRRLSAGLLSPETGSDAIRFVFIRSFPLLTFLPPAVCMSDEGEGLALRISGGLLVQQDQCHRGEMMLLLKKLPDGFIRVTVRLSDYCPLLLGSRRPSAIRRWLYRFTQASIHRMVTVRFLATLYRELGGRATSIKTVRVQVLQGVKT